MVGSDTIAQNKLFNEKEIHARVLFLAARPLITLPAKTENLLGSVYNEGCWRVLKGKSVLGTPFSGHLPMEYSIPLFKSFRNPTYMQHTMDWDTVWLYSLQFFSSYAQDASARR